MKHLRNQLVLLIIFFGSIAISAQNTEWQTDIEEGLRIAQQENKNVLVEFGVVQDGVPLFIYDDIWSDEAIVSKLSSFIPVSIDLKDKADLAKKYEIYYAPTLILLTPRGELVYKTDGLKQLFELDDILGVLKKDVRKICQLKNVYAEDDNLGNLLLMEEYLKLSIKTPDHMADDILKMAKILQISLERGKSEFDKVQKQRFQILEILLDLTEYTDSGQLRKLYKIGKKDLLSSNHSLLLFAISSAEYYSGDDEKALAVYKELKKRIEKDGQAADFCNTLERGFEFN
jgi:hypothetical protein